MEWKLLIENDRRKWAKSSTLILKELESVGFYFLFCWLACIWTTWRRSSNLTYSRQVFIISLRIPRQ